MIKFHAEEIQFDIKEKRKIKKWLGLIAGEENYNIEQLNYIFKPDDGLHHINLSFLKHDTYTDIITFDNSEETGKIEGDIFISIDRVKENAQTYNTVFENELRRVIVHGLLHLCGYKDKSKEDAKLMRFKENHALDIWKRIE